MGTHPIFESDFDCLTELGPKSHGWQKKQHSGQRPLPQGLEAKSPNLVQPARSKGQGCRHRPTTSWWRPSTSCPMPDCPIQHPSPSWTRLHRRSRQERCPKKEVTFFFCVFATCSSA